MTDPTTARHLAEIEDAVRPLLDMAAGLMAASHWWTNDRADSAIGRATPPDLGTIELLLLPMLDYATRARAALDALRAGTAP